MKKSIFENDQDFFKSFELENGLLKAKKMPIGTVSRGRKKIAKGKWVKVKKEKISKEKQAVINRINKETDIKMLKFYLKDFEAMKGTFWNLKNKNEVRIGDREYIVNRIKKLEKKK